MYLVRRVYMQGARLLPLLLYSVASLLLTAALPVTRVYAAGPVSYSLSPLNGSVQPNATVSVALTMTTTVAIAGGSVHVDYGNGAYAGFQSANSSGLSFVYYHPEFNDVVFICNNNNCPPGTYQVATIIVKANQSGTVRVTFAPKETADPNLQTLEANGVTGSYTISSNAPASTTPKTSSQNIFTVPQDNGSGGIKPLQISNENYASQLATAQDINTTSATTTFWTPRNVLLTGFGVGTGFAFVLFLLLKLFGGPPPPGPYGPSGSGPPRAIVG